MFSDVFNVFLSDTVMHLCSNCNRRTTNVLMMKYFFSELKLIKIFLRSSMKEERLISLAFWSIENAFASELDYSSLITKFAAMKAHRVSF